MDRAYVKKSKLLSYIEKHYKTLWPNETEPPRFIGEKALEVAQQREFLALGKLLCKRAEAFYQADRHHALEFALLGWSHSGAWIVWTSGFDGVLMTKALIQNIQEICAQFEGLFLRAEEFPESQKMFSWWADLPRTREYFQCFGSLLANIAVTFIICHELAHAGLGHDRIRRVRSLNASGSESGSVSDKLFDFISECGAAENSRCLDSERLRTSQALEADADINGLKLTRHFVKLDHQIFVKTAEIERSDAFDEAWNSILQNESVREFAIATGVAIGVLALSTNLETPELELLENATHPPLVARLLVILLVNEKCNGGVDVRGEAILIATALIASLLIYREHNEAQKSYEREDTQNVEEDESVRNRIDEVLQRYSVQSALERYDEIGEHFKQLGEEIKRHRVTAMLNQRLKDEHLYRWED